MKNRKAIAITTSLLVSGSVLVYTPRADAFSFGGILDTVTGVAGGIVGNYLGTALSGYIDLGLQNLNQVLGINLPGLGSGEMGLVSPMEAAGEITLSASNGPFTGSLAIDLNPIVDGQIKKGEFNVNYGKQISEGVLGKDAQAATKQGNDGANSAAQSSSKLAQSAQKDNVTQTIQKKISSQNAINTNLLTYSIHKQDMTNTQLAGSNMLNSTIAENSVAQEKRQADSDNAAANYGASSSAFTSGVYEGLGGDQ
jgi:hypothetical protein